MKGQIRKNQCQHGMSLIELMIALTISMTLAAGATQIFISSKQAYNSQDNTSLMQENGRFALDILKRNIREAGFPGTPGDQIDAFDSATTVDGDTDTIAVISENGTDCNGNSLGGTTTKRFFIDNNGDLSFDVNGVACADDDLIEDVQNIQILYGVDTDTNLTANKYVNATAVTAASDWDNVVSVRIGLLLRSDDAGQVEQAMAFQNVATNPGLAMFDIDNDGALELFDSSDAGTAPDTNVAQDDRLYRIFATTITLRNRTQ